jgi:hypothetical protein
MIALKIKAFVKEDIDAVDKCDLSHAFLLLDSIVFLMKKETNPELYDIRSRIIGRIMRESFTKGL